MEKISIMISSTVSNLEGERDAVKEAFNGINFIELIGVDPVNTTSISGNTRTITTHMARNCNVYILILGDKYGLQLKSGKSATEIEFEAAFKDDPTKILIFKKDYDPDVNIEPLQQEFIRKVSDYYNGYWRSTFKFTHQLKDLVINSFMLWLKDRASIGKNLNYLDHFIRIAKQIKPEPNAKVYYKLSEEIVELEYNFFGHSYIIHFSRKEIYDNFWGCINSLQDQFDRWV